MVKPHHFFLLLIVLSCTIIFMNTTLAQTPTYHLNQEWVQIWINADGSIDLFYNISITTDSAQINYVSVGQPSGDFTIANGTDQYGNNLQVQDISSGTDYKIEAKLASTLNTGQTVWLTFVTNVAKMIVEDNVELRAD